MADGRRNDAAYLHFIKLKYTKAPAETWQKLSLSEMGAAYVYAYVYCRCSIMLGYVDSIYDHNTYIRLQYVCSDKFS